MLVFSFKSTVAFLPTYYQKHAVISVDMYRLENMKRWA
jgi:hypothetical protein